jgi:hypothetical protein
VRPLPRLASTEIIEIGRVDGYSYYVQGWRRYLLQYRDAPAFSAGRDKSIRETLYRLLLPPTVYSVHTVKRTLVTGMALGVNSTTLVPPPLPNFLPRALSQRHQPPGHSQPCAHCGTSIVSPFAAPCAIAGRSPLQAITRIWAGGWNADAGPQYPGFCTPDYVGFPVLLSTWEQASEGPDAIANIQEFLLPSHACAFPHAWNHLDEHLEQPLITQMAARYQRFYQRNTRLATY